MRRWIVLLMAVATLAVIVAPRIALAQINYPIMPTGRSDNPNGPTVSPYLNLLNVNSQGFIPFQSQVKPQIDQGNAIHRQGGAIQRLQQQAGSAGGSRGTGHVTSFMNYSHFYPRGSGTMRQ